jgi:hypothetical protein
VSGGVSVPTTFEYLHEDDLGPQILPVELVWDPDDSLRVSFRFQQSVTWRIWCDVVFDALTSDAVEFGDVQFWRDEEHPDCVGLALNGPMSNGSDGRAEFHVPRAALVDVLVGSSVYGELDEWLTELLVERKENRRENF